jgi:hypothetical protein
MKESFKFLSLTFLLLVLTGCSNLLPSSKTTVRSPWESYQGAKLSYEKIIPGSTTKDDLKKLGFDPLLVPNILILTVTEVTNIFIPNPSIKRTDLDPGIQKCIDAGVQCVTYQISPTGTDSDRVGNFWADLFTFKRITVNTGWEFHGIIMIVDGVVTYRDPPGGRPLIKTEQVDIKPLGPLQDIGGYFVKPPPGAL